MALIQANSQFNLLKGKIRRNLFEYKRMLKISGML